MSELPDFISALIAPRSSPVEGDIFAVPTNDGGPDDPFWQTPDGVRLMGEMRQVDAARERAVADEAARRKVEQDAREAERLDALRAEQAERATRDAVAKQEATERAEQKRLEREREIAAIEAEQVSAKAAREAFFAALDTQDGDFHAHQVSLHFEIEGASYDGQHLEADSVSEFWELIEDEGTNRRMVADLVAAATAAIEPWVSHYRSIGMIRADLVNYAADGKPSDHYNNPSFLLIHRAEDAALSADTLGDFAPVRIELPSSGDATLTLHARVDPINATMLHAAARRGGVSVGQWGGEETPDLAPAPDEDRGTWLARVAMPRERLARLVERWAACGRHVELFRRYGDWTERAGGDREIEWVVDGVISRGDITTVVGASGIGKSSVVHSWLTSLSAREPGHPRHVLGIPIAGRYFCALVSGEDGDGFTTYREKKNAAAWQGPADYFVLNDPNATLSDHIEWLLKLPVVDVVVIDTVSSFFTGDEKSSSAVRAFLAPLQRLARLQNCAVILIHHLTKIGESVKSIARMKPHVKGAGDFVSGVRMAIGMTQPNGKKLELEVGPIKHNLPPEMVWLPMETGKRYLLDADTFTLNPIAERGDRSATGGEAVLASVLEAIADQNGVGRVLRRTGRHELFELKLPSLAGISRSAIRSYVTALIEVGRIIDGPDGLHVVTDPTCAPEGR